MGDTGVAQAALGDTGVAQVALGDTGVAQVAFGDTGVALAHVVLCVTSLGCALSARKVTGGPAAGFLLQALVAASSVLSPLWPRVPLGPWICSVLAQPLVAFGCHRLGGDAATADLLLATGAVTAAAAATATAATMAVARHFVTALTAGSLLALAALSADAAGAVAAALVALGDAVAPWAEPWVRVAASAALLGTLRGHRRRLEGQ